MLKHLRVARAFSQARGEPRKPFEQGRAWPDSSVRVLPLGRREKRVEIIQTWGDELGLGSELVNVGTERRLSPVLRVRWEGQPR